MSADSPRARGGRSVELADRSGRKRAGSSPRYGVERADDSAALGSADEEEQTPLMPPHDGEGGESAMTEPSREVDEEEDEDDDAFVEDSDEEDEEELEERRSATERACMSLKSRWTGDSDDDSNAHSLRRVVRTWVRRLWRLVILAAYFVGGVFALQRYLAAAQSMTALQLQPSEALVIQLTRCQLRLSTLQDWPATAQPPMPTGETNADLWAVVEQTPSDSVIMRHDGNWLAAVGRQTGDGSSSSDSSDCVVHLVRRNASLAMPSLAVRVTGRQRSTVTATSAVQLAAGASLSVNGSHADVLLTSLTADAVAVALLQGQIELQQLSVAAGSSNQLHTGRGDVLLTTTQQVDVSFAHPSAMYCLSAPNVTTLALRCASAAAAAGGNSSAAAQNSTDAASAAASNFTAGAGGNAGGSADVACVGRTLLCSAAQAGDGAGEGCAADGMLPLFSISSDDGGIYVNAADDELLRPAEDALDDDSSGIIARNSSLQGADVSRRNGSDFAVQAGVGFSRPLALDAQGKRAVEGLLEWLAATPGSDASAVIRLQGASAAEGVWMFSTRWAYLRVEWLLSTFSASLLAPRLNVVEARLVPGVCPFRGELTTTSELGGLSDVLRRELQATATQGVAYKPRRAVTRLQNVPPLRFSLDVMEDKLAFVRQPDGSYLAIPLQLTMPLLLAIIISCVLALAAAVSGAIALVSYVYSSAARFWKALESEDSYHRLKHARENRVSHGRRKRTGGGRVKRRRRRNDLPHPFAVPDLLLEGLRRARTNSLTAFLAHQTEKVGTLQQQGIQFAAFKVRYEEFCFRMNLRERSLRNAYSALKKFGARYATVCDSTTDAFKRVRLLLPHELEEREELVQLPGEDSLSFFLRKRCKITPFDVDTVLVRDMNAEYAAFCKEHRSLIAVPVTKRSMKEHGIDFERLRSKVIIFAGRHRFLMGDRRARFPSFDPLPRSAIADPLVVLMHLAIIVAVTLPLLAVAMLAQDALGSTSAQPASDMLRFSDFFSRPLGLGHKLSRITIGNGAIALLACALFALAVLELVLYYLTMDFDLNRQVRHRSTPPRKLLHSVILLLALLFAAGTAGYTGLLIVWCILGAVLNPNIFLPYAAAAGTLLVFAVHKAARLATMWSTVEALAEERVNRKLREQLTNTLSTSQSHTVSEDVALDARSLIRRKSVNDTLALFARSPSLRRSAEDILGLTAELACALARGEDRAVWAVSSQEGMHETILRALIAQARGSGDMQQAIAAVAATRGIDVSPELANILVRLVNAKEEASRRLACKTAIVYWCQLAGCGRGASKLDVHSIESLVSLARGDASRLASCLHMHPWLSLFAGIIKAVDSNRTALPGLLMQLGAELVGLPRELAEDLVAICGGRKSRDRLAAVLREQHVLLSLVVAMSHGAVGLLRDAFPSFVNSVLRSGVITASLQEAHRLGSAPPDGEAAYRTPTAGRTPLLGALRDGSASGGAVVPPTTASEEEQMQGMQGMLALAQGTALDVHSMASRAELPEDVALPLLHLLSSGRGHGDADIGLLARPDGSHLAWLADRMGLRPPVLLGIMTLASGRVEGPNGSPCVDAALAVVANRIHLRGHQVALARAVLWLCAARDEQRLRSALAQLRLALPVELLLLTRGLLAPTAFFNSSLPEQLGFPTGTPLLKRLRTRGWDSSSERERRLHCRELAALMRDEARRVRDSKAGNSRSGREEAARLSMVAAALNLERRFPRALLSRLLRAAGLDSEQQRMLASFASLPLYGSRDRSSQSSILTMLTATFDTDSSSLGTLIKICMVQRVTSSQLSALMEALGSEPELAAGAAKLMELWRTDYPAALASVKGLSRLADVLGVPPLLLRQLARGGGRLMDSGGLSLLQDFLASLALPEKALRGLMALVQQDPKQLHLLEPLLQLPPESLELAAHIFGACPPELLVDKVSVIPDVLGSYGSSLNIVRAIVSFASHWQGEFPLVEQADDLATERGSSWWCCGSRAARRPPPAAAAVRARGQAGRRDMERNAGDVDSGGSRFALELSSRIVPSALLGRGGGEQRMGTAVSVLSKQLSLHPAVLSGMLATAENSLPAVRDSIMALVETLDLRESTVRGLISMARGSSDGVEDVAGAARFDVDLAEGLGFLATCRLQQRSFRELRAATVLRRFAKRLETDVARLAGMLALLNNDTRFVDELLEALRLPMDAAVVRGMMVLFAADPDAAGDSAGDGSQTAALPSGGAGADSSDTVERRQMRTQQMMRMCGPLLKLYGITNTRAAVGVMRLVQGDATVLRSVFAPVLSWDDSDVLCISALVLLAQQTPGLSMHSAGASPDWVGARSLRGLSVVLGGILGVPPAEVELLVGAARLDDVWLAQLATRMPDGYGKMDVKRLMLDIAADDEASESSAATGSLRSVRAAMPPPASPPVHSLRPASPLRRGGSGRQRARSPSMRGALLAAPVLSIGGPPGDSAARLRHLNALALLADAMPVLERDVLDWLVHAARGRWDWGNCSVFNHIISVSVSRSAAAGLRAEAAHEVMRLAMADERSFRSLLSTLRDRGLHSSPDDALAFAGGAGGGEDAAASDGEGSDSEEARRARKQILAGTRMHVAPDWAADFDADSSRPSSVRRRKRKKKKRMKRVRLRRGGSKRPRRRGDGDDGEDLADAEEEEDVVGGQAVASTPRKRSRVGSAASALSAAFSPSAAEDASDAEEEEDEGDDSTTAGAGAGAAGDGEYKEAPDGPPLTPVAEDALFLSSVGDTDVPPTFLRLSGLPTTVDVLDEPGLLFLLRAARQRADTWSIRGPAGRVASQIHSNVHVVRALAALAAHDLQTLDSGALQRLCNEMGASYKAMAMTAAFSLGVPVRMEQEVQTLAEQVNCNATFALSFLAAGCSSLSFRRSALEPLAAALGLTTELVVGLLDIAQGHMRGWTMLAKELPMGKLDDAEERVALMHGLTALLQRWGARVRTSGSVLDARLGLSSLGRALNARSGGRCRSMTELLVAISSRDTSYLPTLLTLCGGMEDVRSLRQIEHVLAIFNRTPGAVVAGVEALEPVMESAPDMKPGVLALAAGAAMGHHSLLTSGMNRVLMASPHWASRTLDRLPQLLLSLRRGDYFAQPSLEPVAEAAFGRVLFGRSFTACPSLGPRLTRLLVAALTCNVPELVPLISQLGGDGALLSEVHQLVTASLPADDDDVGEGRVGPPAAGSDGGDRSGSGAGGSSSDPLPRVMAALRAQLPRDGRPELLPSLVQLLVGGPTGIGTGRRSGIGIALYTLASSVLNQRQLAALDTMYLAVSDDSSNRAAIEAGIPSMLPLVLAEQRRAPPAGLEQLVTGLVALLANYPSVKARQRGWRRAEKRLAEAFDTPVATLKGFLYMARGEMMGMLDMALAVGEFDPRRVQLLDHVLVRVMAIVKEAESMTAAQLEEGGSGEDTPTPEEVAEMSVDELFRYFDKDSSGSLDFQEFRDLIKYYKLTVSEQRMLELFAQVDMDGSESISAAEFGKGMSLIRKMMVDEVLEQAGITTRRLVFLFATSVLLLTFLFLFIFFGIAGFTTGSSFGSVVNSILPVSAGASLSGGDDREQPDGERDDEKVDAMVTNAFDIVSMD